MAFASVSRSSAGWRSCRHCHVVSSVPSPSVSIAPPSSAKSIGSLRAFEQAVLEQTFDQLVVAAGFELAAPTGEAEIEQAEAVRACAA
jgi:hypothetical protein